MDKQMQLKGSVISFILGAFLIGLAGADVDHIHWGSKNNPLNGLTVTWRSLSNVNCKIKWGYTSQYEKGIFASVHKRKDEEGYLHDYSFPVVKPRSTIYYSIQEGASWSKGRTFKTSVDTSSTHFTFIVGGDSRCKREGDDATGWRDVAGRIKSTQADFYLHTGDMVYTGYEYFYWKQWYDYGKDFLEKSLIFPAAGNHEKYYRIFRNQFVYPPNPFDSLYYSFEFGNAIFICMKKASDIDKGQLAWLKETLATTTKTWVIVYFHRPFYTGSKHAHSMDDRFSTWWKAFDDYGVDVILTGHCHNYMRSKPINRNISTASAVKEYGSKPGQGRMQIITGGWGAPLSSASVGWFVAKTSKVYHSCKLTINGNMLHMDAIKTDGSLIDSVTIIKGPLAPSFVLTPASAYFAAIQGGNNPTPKQVSIEAINLSLTGLTASSNKSWLQVTATGSGATGTVTNSVNLSLANGTDTAMVTVTAGGVTRQYKVVLTLLSTSVSLPLVPNWEGFGIKAVSMDKQGVNFGIFPEKRGAYSLSVYDIVGRKVWEHNGKAEEGSHLVTWNFGAQEQSKVYFVVFNQGNIESVRRFLTIAGYEIMP